MHSTADRGDKVTHVFGRAGSSTASTLSTAIGESSEEYCDTTLLLSDLRSTSGLTQAWRCTGDRLESV